MPYPVCETCGRPIGTPGVCLQCLVDPPDCDRMLSSCRFEGLLRDVIHKFKYHRATVFKGFLAGLVHTVILSSNLKPDILTFVPLHWSRMILRGYNQSALIARELAGYMGLDVRYGILCKIRRTTSQVGLPKAERERNLTSAFSAKDVEDRSVMVVDDVITTGRTASEISRALKKAGARQVIFVSVARTVS